MHLRPEENKKKKMSMSITFAPSLPYNSTEEGDFLEGGGTNFQASSIATAFEISTWNFVGMFF